MRESAFMRSRVAFACGVVLVAALASACRAPARIERVVLLGFDGVGWNLAEPLIRQGRLPALRRLREQGASGSLRTFQPTKSNILWTSVATGKSMLKHGIVDWTFVSREGLVVPYEDAGRRAKAYWEFLDEAGLPTVTLNWWVSHPPAPLRHGVVVSSAFKRRSDATTVHPPALFAPLDALRVPYPAGVDEVRRREGIPEWREEDATSPMGGTREILRSYSDYLAQDATVDRASDWLWANRPAPVFSTYFRLPDITSHFATHFLDRPLHEAALAKERAGVLAAEDVARLDEDFARVVMPAYAFVDRIVAKYLEHLDERTLLILCSDHGFRFFRGRYNHAMPEMEPPDGFVVVYGPGVRAGARLEGASLYDIAPTILWAMGRPVAEDMDGSPLRAFDAAWLEAHPLQRIASYEGTSRAQAERAPNRRLDEHTLEDGRTLGYMGGAEPPSPRP